MTIQRPLKPFLNCSVASTANRCAGNRCNQDAYLIQDAVFQGEHEQQFVLENPTDALFAVSDGVRTSPCAARASHKLLTLLASIHRLEPSKHPGRKLRALHEQFIDGINAQKRCYGMSATLIAAEITSGVMTLYHVGDSRGWLIRDGEIQRLTTDHTILARMIEEHEILPEEAEGLATLYDGLDRCFVADSSEEKPQHDLTTLELRDGDEVVLTSDGVEAIPDSWISAGTSCQSSRRAQQLITKAIETGSDDNITVIAIQYRESPVP